MTDRADAAARPAGRARAVADGARMSATEARHPAAPARLVPLRLGQPDLPDGRGDGVHVALPHLGRRERGRQARPGARARHPHRARQPVRLHRHRGDHRARRADAARRRARRPHRPQARPHAGLRRGRRAGLRGDGPGRAHRLAARRGAVRRRLPRLQLLDRGQLLAAGRPVDPRRPRPGVVARAGRSPTSAAASCWASTSRSAWCSTSRRSPGSRCASPACGGWPSASRCGAGCPARLGRGTGTVTPRLDRLGRASASWPRPSGRCARSRSRWRSSAAFLIYNDGIQTVTTVAAQYGDKELQLSDTVLLLGILLVQFVAFARRAEPGPAGRALRRQARRAGHARRLAGASC